MKFSFNKVLAAFGNMRAMERTHVDNYTEDIINSIKDKPYAISKENVMYAAVKELGGFYYFKTIIVGSFKIKTMKGATLLVSHNDFEYELKTDMDEFESDYSNISNRFITRIDFQIEEKEATILEEKNIDSLTLKAKRHVIFFNELQG
jgi:hypothetical protein